MSAFVIDFRQDRIIVATDTLAYAPDRHNVKPLGFISKVIPIPHLHCLIFGRGMAKIIFQAAVELMLSPNLADIEDAATALPDALRRITDAYADENQIDHWGEVGLADVNLVGWSERSRRMRIFVFENTQDAYACQTDSASNFLRTTPALPPHWTPKIDGLTLDQRLIALIKAERDLFDDERELACGAAIGGEVVAWKLEPSSISQRVLFRFPDYERVKNAAAAVFSRLLRGDYAVDLNSALIPADEMVAGEDIRKEAAEVAPLAPGASRAERRRAERVARKAAKRAA
jgi:hypothetical protein